MKYRLVRYTFRFVKSQDKYTDIPSKYLVCLHKIFKRSSSHVLRHLQDMSSRRLQDMSLRHVFKMSSRRLARGLPDVFKTSSKRLCKTSSKRLGRSKIVTLKTFEDVFKINRDNFYISQFPQSFNLFFQILVLFHFFFFFLLYSYISWYSNINNYPLSFFLVNNY